jgi:hypothetical protein
MLEFLEFHTWEATLLVLVIFVMWGLLRERARRKRVRQVRGDTQRIAKQLLIRSAIQPNHTPSGQMSSNGNWAAAGEYDIHPILPLSHDPAETNDRYVVAALGMEESRQDFYRQAWEASHNNEYMAMKPGSW